MSWTLYRWVWRLRSPLHIGHTPAGALNRTRLYIPARNMWAALTAEIARCQASNFPDYAGLSQALQQHARFTYLYPAECVNGKWHAWLPRYVQEEKHFGLYWYREDGAVDPLSDLAFRGRLLHTQASTAIAAGTGAAEGGTLREVECIQPHWHSNSTKPVAFVGYLFLHTGIDLAIENALRAVQELYLGGETRYGFGHVSLIPHSSQDLWKQTNSCFGAQANLTQDDPLIENPHYLLAHTFQDYDLAGKGAWELLVYWDWDAFHSLKSPLWVPGTRVGDDARFVVLGSGIWQAQM